MKFKKAFAVIALLLLLFSIAACKENKKNEKAEEELVNILEQPDDYVGKFKVPSSKDVEEGSALSIICYINEEVDEIEEAIKTSSDDVYDLESYSIDCYGVDIEIFKCHDSSKKLSEARESGTITFYSAQGKELAKRIAATNGNYVIMFRSSSDSNSNDCSEKNNEIIKKFKELDLE